MGLIFRQTASVSLNVSFFQNHDGAVSVDKRAKKNTLHGED
jgi:hypothetical protein